LYSIQFSLQLVIMAIKEYYLNFVYHDSDKLGRVPLGIPYIREGGEILGLTGDNSTKKRIIEHTAWKTFTLPFFSFLILFYYDFMLPTWMNLVLSVFLVVLLKFSGIFLLFKIYTGTGKGVGFNLYFNGWRIIGLDYHNWQVKQHPVTGKPLAKSEQFFSPARPHIDLPTFHLHHWPWEQHNDHETLEDLKKVANERRSEKLARKQAKKAIRAEKVLKRKTTTTTTTTLDDQITIISQDVQNKEDEIVNTDLFS